MTDKQIIERLKTDLDFERSKRKTLQSELTAKEQECEELKKIIDEAKNSKLDLKSFLVGEAVQNEYEQQLDQLKAELEAYKMEAEEGKEINAELKAENKHLNDLLNQALKELEKTRETLIEIKEIAEQILDDDDNHCPFGLTKQILHKINECEVNND